MTRFMTCDQKLITSTRITHALPLTPYLEFSFDGKGVKCTAVADLDVRQTTV